MNSKLQLLFFLIFSIQGFRYRVQLLIEFEYGQRNKFDRFAVDTFNVMTKLIDGYSYATLFHVLSSRDKMSIVRSFDTLYQDSKITNKLKRRITFVGEKFGSSSEEVKMISGSSFTSNDLNLKQFYHKIEFDYGN